MKLHLDDSSAIPIYEQLKQAILLEILSGKLKPGDSLPSIRSLAKLLRINPNTVVKVYNTLEDGRFVEGKRGSGFKVVERRQRSDKLKYSMVKNEMKNFLEKAVSLGFGKNEILSLIKKELGDE